MTTGVFCHVISAEFPAWYRWKLASGQDIPIDEHGIALYPPWGAPLARFDAARRIAYGR